MIETKWLPIYLSAELDHGIAIRTPIGLSLVAQKMKREDAIKMCNQLNEKEAARTPRRD